MDEKLKISSFLFTIKYNYLVLNITELYEHQFVMGLNGNIVLISI